jgi:hypothetical protein
VHSTYQLFINTIISTNYDSKNHLIGVMQIEINNKYHVHWLIGSLAWVHQFALIVILPSLHIQRRNDILTIWIAVVAP